jgi:hypothetical protein
MKFKLALGTIAVLAACATAAMAGGQNAPAQLRFASLVPLATSSSDAPGTKLVTITDPVLNMKAYSIVIPANWIFEGAVFPGSSCSDGPFPVFRMSSPDGLTGIKQLPRLDWSWTDNSDHPSKGGADCLPYKKEMSAADMLKYMIGVLQVEFVTDDPTPDLADIQRNTAARDTPKMSFSADKARATVRYHINKIVMEERLNVYVGCTTFRDIGWHTCSAGVSRTWAPQGKYNDDTFRPISRTFAVDQDWNAKRAQIAIQKLTDLSEQSMRAIKQMGDETARRSAAQYNTFKQAQETRQRQHEDFMASMQRGTDMSMQRTAQSMNARSRAADDWCDYSLDLQKRLDPNTGLITKDSSAYSYTWVNEQGDRVQTNNINANPNGNGTGNWALQENVR